MNRFFVVFFVALVPLLTSVHSLGAPNRPGLHEMLVIGKGPFFLYHLPTFSIGNQGHKHAYQGVWEVHFSKGGKNFDSEAQKLAKESTFKVLSVEPARPFLLTDLGINTKSYPGNLYGGHFLSRKSKLLAKGLTISFQKKAIHLRSLSQESQRTDVLQYFSFGQNPTFLAKWQTVRPDKDQILAIKQSLPNNTKVRIKNRKDIQLLSGGDILSAETLSGKKRKNCTLNVESQLYLEPTSEMIQ